MSEGYDKGLSLVLSLLLNFNRRFSSAFPLTAKYDVTFSTLSTHSFTGSFLIETLHNLFLKWKEKLIKRTSSLPFANGSGGDRELDRKSKDCVLNIVNFQYVKCVSGEGGLSMLHLIPPPPHVLSSYCVSLSFSMCFLFNVLTGMWCSWH